MKKSNKNLSYKVIECVNGFAVIRMTKSNEHEVMQIFTTREQAVNSLTAMPFNEMKSTFIGGVVGSCIRTDDEYTDVEPIACDTAYNGYLLFVGSKLTRTYQKPFYALQAAKRLLINGETAEQYNIRVERWVGGIYDCELLLTPVTGRYVYSIFDDVGAVA